MADIVGFVVTLSKFLADTLLGHRRQEKRQRQRRLENVTRAYLDLRRSGKTAGLDGLQRAGAAALESDAEIREAADIIRQHGENDPLQRETLPLIDHVDLKSFFGLAAERSANLFQGEVIKSLIDELKGVQSMEMSESEPGLGAGQVSVWLFHEEELATSRLVAFLTVHGLLLTAASIIAALNTADWLSIRAIALLGVFLGVVWLLEHLRGVKNVHILCELLKTDSAYSGVLSQMWRGPVGKIRRVWLLAVLPAAAIVGWLILLLRNFVA